MKIRPAADCVSAEVAGTTIVLSPEMQFVQLDAVGAAIWEVLLVSSDVDVIVSTLIKEFKVDRVTLISDIQTFLPKLVAVGLAIPVDD